MDCSHIHTLFDIFHNADSLLILRLMYLSLTLLSCEILNKNLLGNFFTGVIVKQPFFDPLRDEALYDDGEFWEVSVVISVFERALVHVQSTMRCNILDVPNLKTRQLDWWVIRKKWMRKTFPIPLPMNFLSTLRGLLQNIGSCWFMMVHNFVVQLMNLNGWKVVGMFKRSPCVYIE